MQWNREGKGKVASERGHCSLVTKGGKHGSIEIIITTTTTNSNGNVKSTKLCKSVTTSIGNH